LKGYDFVYDGYSGIWGGAVANIVKKEGSEVWGCLYEIDESDLEKLDRFEGFPKIYDRKIVIVVDDAGKYYEAFVYIRPKPKDKGEPSDKYRKTVIKGAKECGLPEWYIEEKLQGQYGEGNRDYKRGN
jgi:gamma-glutamylcyclotransferase